jgi:DNA adenine methylase
MEENKEGKTNMKYLAGEINESVVKMWNAAKKGWKPPTKNYGRKKWYKLKDDGKTSAIKGFVGHSNTLRGIYFGSYFEHKNSKIKTNSERVQNIGNILKKNNVTLTNGNYAQFSNLRNYVIYCDPPYKNTETHYSSGFKNRDKSNFYSRQFYEWCRKMSKDNIVFVSEYSAPKDFEKIWSKKSNLTGIINTSNKRENIRTEKLFLLY